VTTRPADNREPKRFMVVTCTDPSSNDQTVDFVVSGAD
jgi:hypothetical protein